MASRNLVSIDRVASFQNLRYPTIHPFEAVRKFFHDGDPVLITECVHSVDVIIAKDRQGKIVVTTVRSLHEGLVLEEYLQETRWTRIKQALTGWPIPQRNTYWKAAITSSILGYLRNWPPIPAEVQIIASLIPSYYPRYSYTSDSTKLDLRISQILVDGKSQGYHTFFPNWVPLLASGPFDEGMLELAKGMEMVSGNSLHPRYGIVIQHLHAKGDRPLFAFVPNITHGLSSTSDESCRA